METRLEEGVDAGQEIDDELDIGPLSQRPLSLVAMHERFSGRRPKAPDGGARG